MTVNLSEGHVGFHLSTLGFPSIRGCIAIVVVLPGGLYGYHSYGGVAKDAWLARAPKFKEYIEYKGGDPRQATRVYGVTHVADRGYGGVVKQGWTDELKTYAEQLGARCRISGYNLNDAVRAGFHKFNHSAYVEFRKVGTKCNVWVQTWDDVAHTKIPASKNTWGDNIRTIKAGTKPSLEDVAGDIYDPIIPTNALKQISKTKLAG